MAVPKYSEWTEKEKAALSLIRKANRALRREAKEFGTQTGRYGGMASRLYQSGIVYNKAYPEFAAGTAVYQTDEGGTPHEQIYTNYYSVRQVAANPQQMKALQHIAVETAAPIGQRRKSLAEAYYNRTGDRKASTKEAARKQQEYGKTLADQIDKYLRFFYYWYGDEQNEPLKVEKIRMLVNNATSGKGWHSSIEGMEKAVHDLEEAFNLAHTEGEIPKESFELFLASEGTRFL